MTDKQMKVQRFVAITDNGVADAKRYHTYRDCSAARFENERDVEELSERETKLLGLKVCSVCEKRASGGPAHSVLALILQAAITDLEKNGFDDFQADQAAYHTIEKLKEQGFYIAQRQQKKDGASSPS